MSRYDWSRQESYPAYPAGTVPHVTESDFSYITSEDIDPPQHQHHHAASYPSIDPRYSNHDLGVQPEYEEDDVLHIVFPEGREFQVQFPAYSIGDGKLRVRDVQARIAFLLAIPDNRVPYISLTYKGRRLKDPEELVRFYGCKNNSELWCKIPDKFPDEIDRPRASSRHTDPDYVDADDSETVVVTDENGRVVRKSGRGRRQSSAKHSPSPRASGASLHVPQSPSMGNSSSKRASSQLRSGKLQSPAMKKLAEISDHFDANLKPLCEEFARSPPADKQKREEEHKRLEETTMQQVILKLDEVQADGDDEVRQTRKDLVRHVQDVLKMIDSHK